MTSDKNQTHALSENQIQADSWGSLKSLTEARICLGRAGVSIPTRAQLQFNLDHALARDAVNIPLSMYSLQEELQQKNITSLRLHSRVIDRREYLQRPDLGRRLNEDSVATLASFVSEQKSSPDVALVLVDGLSSTGVQQQGARLCEAIQADCAEAGFSVSPVCLVEQGRVAIGDEIGELLAAKTVILVVGERPGLSSPDSLGIYFTYGPEIGLNDASRNCISNIREGGLSVNLASEKALWLLQESCRLKLSGVNLKDKAESAQLTRDETQAANFLLPSAISRAGAEE